MPARLSKTRIVAARQCPKRLWLEVNHPELRVVSRDTERRFRQGHRLNDLVHTLFADGVLIGPEVPLSEALGVTRRHLSQSPARPLFEATFSKHGVLVRADVFEKGHNAWRLTEVKSSTGVKPYHLIDCAVQAWVIEGAGCPIEQTFLAHVDTGFVYAGDGNYDGLLNFADVTPEVATLTKEVPAWVAVCVETLQGPEPRIDVGPQCNDPFACPFIEHCWPPAPEYPVTLLPNGGRVVEQLIAEGIDDVRDIPEGRLGKGLHERVRVATVTGKPFVAEALGEALDALPYPRHYLDFESIQFVVPIWAETRPYEQLPFQWSCHTEQDDGALSHAAFLETSGNAPMRPCAEKLLECLGTRGPILSYSPFERTVIRHLANRFPDLAPVLLPLTERIVDLLPLVKQHFYHPAMKGSFSIKAVLPVVAPHLSYASLGDVADGTAAQSAFEEAIDPATEASRRRQLERQLLDYCALDTLAMVELVRFFQSP